MFIFFAVAQLRIGLFAIGREIGGGIKWNAPSFRPKEYFASVNIRGNVGRVIFRRGMKVKDHSTTGLTINAPIGLLERLAKERAPVKRHEGGQGGQGKQRRIREYRAAMDCGLTVSWACNKPGRD